MKQILLVAYHFPPTAASGAFRPLGFCRYLGEYGWKARVLTTNAESIYPPHTRDPSLGARLPSDLLIDVVPYKDLLQTILGFRNNLRRRFSSVKSETPAVGPLSEQANYSSRGWRGVKDCILDRLFSFPDPQCSWFHAAFRQASKLTGQNRPDLVLATGGPWTSLLLGQALAKHFDVPFIADLRDPWTSNPYSSFSCRWLNSKAKRLEKTVFNAAASVIANTEGLCQILRREHPELQDRFVTITNGYDFEAPSQRDEVMTPLQNQCIELAHFGTVYGKRNPYPLLEAVTTVLNTKPGMADRLKLRFIGAWENTDFRCESLALDLEKRGILRREPPIPHHLCLEQMAKAKALLILQPDSPLQVPAKIYEYIATGRPLIVIGGEGATSDLVKQNNLGVCCQNEMMPLSRLLETLVAGRVNLKPPDKDNVAKFHYQRLTSRLADVLDSAYSKRNARCSDNHKVCTRS